MSRFGALPPPSLEWQLGKTAASILFVNDAEIFISTCQDEKKIELLHAAIKDVKSGQLVLREWLTPEKYLEQKTP